MGPPHYWQVNWHGKVVSDGEWHHIVGVCTPTHIGLYPPLSRDYRSFVVAFLLTKTRRYIDGEMEVVEWRPATDNLRSTAPVDIGVDRWDPSTRTFPFSAGRIRNIRFYNQAISAHQVKSIRDADHNNNL